MMGTGVPNWRTRAAARVVPAAWVGEGAILRRDERPPLRRRAFASQGLLGRRCKGGDCGSDPQAGDTVLKGRRCPRVPLLLLRGDDCPCADGRRTGVWAMCESHRR